ncbi:MAG: polyribonucleotide nucleotidyltransferase [Dehalococcoidia bacterium]|nr:polyribonucleotide nucleotidyltransferase [Dehalococcoidia bacterium]
MSYAVSMEVAGRTLTIETGKLANQANGSVTVRYGDTLLLVTACVAPTAREGVDFLPLTIDYEERLYAAGKIPGSFFRREGRPSQEGTLAARLTDRPLRPLFPKGFRNEIQVVITVLSADQENDPDILGIIGASSALCLSDIPFEGPVGATRLGYVDGAFVVNPTFPQLGNSKLDLVVAGTRDAIAMVEAGASEVSEEIVLEALRRGQEINQEIISLQEELIGLAGKPKTAFTVNGQADEGILSKVASLLGDRLYPAIFTHREKGEEDDTMRALRAEVTDRLGRDHPPKEVAAAFETLVKKELRSRIVQGSLRPDGRRPTEIRPISCEVSILPRAHGSGLFTRGMTQVITIATLGSMAETQKLDTIGPEETRRYMHHYNFPGYSVGEVRRTGGPGRREIGHGALAERALLPVVPGEAEFPYTIRLVSEVIGSNGSTSMASICGSSLALMDAGVPIRAPVAGVAMGLVMVEGGQYVVLTDIQGVEDALGDMDFKVAGTTQGITALQMDIKVKGITYRIMEEALRQALEARLFVLGKIRDTMAQPRPDLSPYAPRMLRITIPVGKIGAVIGPGGKTIRSIIEETKTTINVDNDGTVTIGSTSPEAAKRAVERIEMLTREAVVGAIYTGKVVRLMNFGAFVEILPGKDGLVHISEISEERVGAVEDVVKVGDEITVMVTEIDAMGRINLSRRAALLQGVPRGAGPGEGSAAGRPPFNRGGQGPEDDRPRGPRPPGNRPFSPGNRRPPSSRP